MRRWRACIAECRPLPLSHRRRTARCAPLLQRGHRVFAESGGSATSDQLPRAVENIQASIDVRLLLRVKAAGGTASYSELAAPPDGVRSRLAEQIGVAHRHGACWRSSHRTRGRSISREFGRRCRCARRRGGGGLAQALRTASSSEALVRFALGTGALRQWRLQRCRRDPWRFPPRQWLAQGREDGAVGNDGDDPCPHPRGAGQFFLRRWGTSRPNASTDPGSEASASQTGRLGYDQEAALCCCTTGRRWFGAGRVLAPIPPSMLRWNTPTSSAARARDRLMFHARHFRPGLSAALGRHSAGNIRARQRWPSVGAVGGGETQALQSPRLDRQPRAALGVRPPASPKAQSSRGHSPRDGSAFGRQRAYGHRGVEVGATRACWPRPSLRPATSPATSSDPYSCCVRGHRARGDHREAIPSVASCGLLPARDLDQEWPTRRSAEVLQKLSDRRRRLSGMCRRKRRASGVSSPSWVGDAGPPPKFTGWRPPSAVPPRGTAARYGTMT